jgi:pseudouridine-5'-phosphate glycosidase
MLAAEIVEFLFVAWDISADLNELGRTPVAVVCAGVKSILGLLAIISIL